MSSGRMRKIRKANYPLVVKKSRIAGEGAFAVKAIPWGVKIIEYPGAVISNAEAARRAANGGTASHSGSVTRHNHGLRSTAALKLPSM